MNVRILLPLCFLAAACNPPAPIDAPAESTTSATATPVSPPAPAAPTPAAAPPTDSVAPVAADSVQWMPWEQALARAQAENRAMMVLVYADWCSRCRELRPVFDDPRVVEASRNLVMVQHNQDEAAPWLQSVVGDTQSYVPRVMFLNPDGTQKTELISPHPRYPLFYVPQMLDVLVSNMAAAARG